MRTFENETNVDTCNMSVGTDEKRIFLGCRNLVPSMAVRRQPGDHPVLEGRPRIPQAAPVLLPRRQRQRIRPQYPARRRGLDGRLQAVLLQRRALGPQHSLRQVSPWPFASFQASSDGYRYIAGAVVLFVAAIFYGLSSGLNENDIMLI